MSTDDLDQPAPTAREAIERGLADLFGSTCIGCGARIPTEDDACEACITGEAVELPDPEGDGFIYDQPRGGYDIALEGRHLGHFADRDEAERALADAMEASRYWPTAWLIDDHGGHLAIDLPDEVDRTEG